MLLKSQNFYLCLSESALLVSDLRCNQHGAFATPTLLFGFGRGIDYLTLFFLHLSSKLYLHFRSILSFFNVIASLIANTAFIMNRNNGKELGMKKKYAEFGS